MNWVELSITVNHEVSAIVADMLEELGSNGVVIEDSTDLEQDFEDRYGEVFELNRDDYPDEGVRIKAYFNEMKYTAAFKQQLLDNLNEIEQMDQNLLKVEEQTLEEQDWENEWKNYFHPFRASERFTIVPSWESYQKENEDELCIELDPGMAFGTGDHPTTSMCLKAIERYVKPSDAVIDVGTGSGILSIACHLLGVERIKALDLDEMAVKVAQDNFRKNNCVDQIEAVPSDLLTEETGHFDVVIANILAHIIDEMIEDAYDVVNEAGYFITSGIIESKYESIIEHMERVGFKIISTEHQNDWVCIVGQKVSD
ncbi:50S ribosomal protein L11 methyltransferase [Staphylococcus auricularis]|uniref:Ribosomal protein L11 methyltransferase n=1 Tax=Staphylococcus auricularis TaxID=29379 RepID=A0AAP8TSH8_9STAP|nr:50S ribosomal protein L11 methyltransferase [Staphylococcus auricularis]MBM0867995.1 50S ribosomal protein L11 methyltransferase [Staphylococcus auricularis]MCG7341007.1 50S ribosomal protein L11 methyltransferase [Staphylococcus auricularis]MDC6326813.1 50S ribosomal protein L11 methyltransferase [Staphylococcus auricularis]MDN4532690.1 50S ribosomal protein L11 methyltransferase [Staphylococcus auricularis]PNZ66112.1 50S ribosomal protein L11 methyltransferase [Staphylococcus auricularis]